MESKSFTQLPSELQLEIAKNLSTGDLVNLAKTSKYHLFLFKPMIDARNLLHHVVRGEYDAVEVILKNAIKLIFIRGKVRDCSGREFEDVSGFEYALWALDKYMWSKMINCIPENLECLSLFKILIAQYNKVNTYGVTYNLNGETITERHFDFNNTIIKELQTQVESIKAPGAKNWDAIDKQWREGVGGTQRLLPMHVVYEYCSDQPFYPVPEFITQPKLSKKIYNWEIGKSENWFGGDSKLGFDFAIYKGVRRASISWIAVRGSVAALLHGATLTAIKVLGEVRTKDFINLKSSLEKQPPLYNSYHSTHDF